MAGLVPDLTLQSFPFFVPLHRAYIGFVVALLIALRHVMDDLRCLC
jgi:hypothetical protein